MPLKRAMTKRKRMWGAFMLGQPFAVETYRDRALAYTRDVRPVLVTWTPKPSAKPKGKR